MKSLAGYSVLTTREGASAAHTLLRTINKMQAAELGVELKSRIQKCDDDQYYVVASILKREDTPANAIQK